MNQIVITNHAYKRAKERCGWNRSATTRMAAKVSESGTSIRDIKGSLKPWTEKKLEQGGTAESKIYGDVLYVIRNGVLITMYHVPTKVRVQNRICKKHIDSFAEAAV